MEKISNISMEIFEKIKKLPVDAEFKIGDFFSDYEINMDDKFKIQKEAMSLCENNNVKIINLQPDAVLGMPWVFPYKKIN